MSLAALVLTTLVAQSPTGTATAAASMPAPTATETATAARVAPPPPEVPPPPAAAQVAPQAAPPPAPPPAPPAVTAEAAPPPMMDAEGSKSVLLAWALSFFVPLGTGNWYAEAYGDAAFVLIGELAGAGLLIGADGSARGAGLVTLAIFWVLDWSQAIGNARDYNAALVARGEHLPPTEPEGYADTNRALPAQQAMSLSFGF